MVMDLHARFLSFARSHGAGDATAEAWWRTVAAHYGEPTRHYHTLTHIDEMLALLPDADETTLAAVWFHDVIYGGEANEERSAALARHALGELHFPPETVALVEQMILATKRHDPASVPESRRDFLDADLAILGSDPDRYQNYAEDIRREYDFVSDEAFAAGRGRVLRAFLARPSIYATEPFRARFEAQARENVERELS